MLLALCSSPLWSHQHSCRWELFRSNYVLTRTIADMEVHHTTTDLLFSTWEKDDCLAQLTTFADILGHLVLKFGEASVPVILRSQSSFKHRCSSTCLRLKTNINSVLWSRNLKKLLAQFCPIKKKHILQKGFKHKPESCLRPLRCPQFCRPPSSTCSIPQACSLCCIVKKINVKEHFCFSLYQICQRWQKENVNVNLTWDPILER